MTAAKRAANVHFAITHIHSKKMQRTTPGRWADRSYTGQIRCWRCVIRVSINRREEQACGKMPPSGYQPGARGCVLRDILHGEQALLQAVGMLQGCQGECHGDGKSWPPHRHTAPHPAGLGGRSRSSFHPSEKNQMALIEFIECFLRRNSYWYFQDTRL